MEDTRFIFYPSVSTATLLAFRSDEERHFALYLAPI